MNARDRPQKPPSDHPSGPVGYPVEWWFGSDAERLTSPPRLSGSSDVSTCSEGDDIASRPQGTSSGLQSGSDEGTRPSSALAPKSPSSIMQPLPDSASPSPSSSSPSPSSSSPSPSSQEASTTDSSYSESEYRKHVLGEKVERSRLSWSRLRPKLRPKAGKSKQVDPRNEVDANSVQDTSPDATSSSESDQEPPKPQVPEKPMSLTEVERAMYASESQDNFRWLSKLVGTYADCKLTKEVGAKEKNRINEIGMYSELVYSHVQVDYLFQHHQLLEKESILSEYLPVLSDCIFIRKIDGPKTDLSAFVVYRKSQRQLVVSISGSSSPKHMIENLRAVRTPWPGASSESPDTSTTTKAPAATVHSGFLRLYQDVKSELQEAIRGGLETHQPEELIITGHSMGGSVSHLLCIDLLSKNLGVTLPKKICLATYGAPRTGNLGLVQHFQDLVTAFRSQEGNVFDEYSLKAYNDGVPAVPPNALGYVHFSDKPLYAFQRGLYIVPEGFKEFSLFHVETPGTALDEAPSDPNAQANRFPKGGHNYYNGRDLEALRRTTDRLASAGFPGNPKWKENFWKGEKEREVMDEGAV